MVYKWSQNCIDSYHQAFFENRPVGALKSCLSLLRKCHETLIALGSKELIKFTDFEAELRESVSVLYFLHIFFIFRNQFNPDLLF